MSTIQKTLFGVGVLLVAVGVILAASAALGPAEDPYKTQGKLDWDLYHKPTVMTVGYKAYGNPKADNGRYWLAKLVLSNDGGGSIRDIAVSFRIPNYVEWTTPDNFEEVLPGQTVVLPFYPKLPKKVTTIRSESPASLECKITYKEYDDRGTLNTKTKTQKYDFKFRGVTEIEYTSLPPNEILNWYDIYDNVDILAAYVTDEDPVVKKYLAKITEATGTVPPISSGQQVELLLSKIWAFENATGMKYLAAKGFPDEVGDSETYIQSVRLPREVISGNAGLCIDLTLLMCSLCSAAGAKPQIVLMKGHAFALIVAGNGEWRAIETTALGQMNIGDAMKYAQETLTKLFNGQAGPYRLIDVAQQHRRGLLPPELEPIPQQDIEELLEGRLQKFYAATRTQPVATTHQPAPPRQETAAERAERERREAEAAQREAERIRQEQERLAREREEREERIREQLARDFELNGIPYTEPSGLVEIRYPNGWAVDWRRIQRAAKRAPWYKFRADDKKTKAGVRLYMFDYTDPAQARSAVQQYFHKSGVQLTYGPEQNVQIDGRDALTYTITATNERSQSRGQFALISLGESYAGVLCIAPVEHHSTLAPLFNLMIQATKILPI